MRGAYERTLEILGESRLVRPSSIVIAEHEKKYDPGEKFGALARYREIVQGEATLSLYRVNADW
jgi:16S rRNA G966 N2-methylase RsmD